jgi:vitamin B12 transporter
MSLWGRRLCRIVLICAVAVTIPAAFASTIKGTVTNTLGERVPGAEVRLQPSNPGRKSSAPVTTDADGSFTLDAAAGRYVLVVSAQGFESTRSDSFYISGNEIVTQTVTIAPAHVSTQVTVTATGVPTPQAQVSSAVTVLGENELTDRLDVTEPLTLVPGLTVVQQGQAGGVTSLFIRGGDSTANKVLINGLEANDVGGQYDYGTVLAGDLQTIEVYRGADSVLYGSDAAAGVVSINTKQGTSVTPLVHLGADGGNFGTAHGQGDISGVMERLDYFVGANGYNTGNSIPNDSFRDTTYAGNLGYSLPWNLQLRGTVRYSNSASGVPNAWNFYQIADEAHQGDQDMYATGVLEQQTTDRWHNLVRYGAARKRDQYVDYAQVGLPDLQLPGYGYTTGLPVVIRGANGYTVSGQAILDYGCYSTPCSNNLTVSNRDEVYYQSDYRFSPHLIGLFGFRFDDERGLSATDYGTTLASRRNYDYTLQFNGDFKNRLFYSLGGGLQKNEIFGVQETPRVGLAYYLVRPGNGFFQGSKLLGNFSKGVQEPSLTAQTQSLFALLGPLPNGPQLIQEFGITPIGAETSRSYDGGVEQSFFHQKAILRARYFHNEFGNQVEFVYTQALAQLGVPQDVVNELLAAGVFGAYVNSLSYSAQGAETEIQAQFSSHLFVRAGYTYLDANVQHSFSSDALQPSFNPVFPSIAIGAYDPLIGARPFRRPPHTGFFMVSYRQPRWYLALSGSLASRSDDSTFQLDNDAAGGNTLLLPNRNLDQSYQRINLGGEYRLTTWMSICAQAENLLSQTQGVIGYPSLLFNFRSGLKFTLGGQPK